MRVMVKKSHWERESQHATPDPDSEVANVFTTGQLRVTPTQLLEIGTGLLTSVINGTPVPKPSPYNGLCLLAFLVRYVINHRHDLR